MVATIVAGCGDEAPGPSSDDFALAADGLASIDSEAEVVDAIELSLSGDMTFVPSPDQDLDPLANVTAAADRASVFAQGRLSPASCIVSSMGSPNVTHVLTNCSIHGRTVSGTVTSVWGLEDTLHVDHQALDLQIDGRAFDLRVSVSGYASATAQTRHRDVIISTGSPSGGSLVITGEWGATLDTTTDCASKSGSSSVAFDGLELVRRDVGLTWCGDGNVDTLMAGRLELVRGATAVSLEFLGDGQVILDGDNYLIEATVSDLRD